MDISEEAVEYVKKYKDDLIEKYSSIEEYPPVSDPITFFMAGSPGAGKTEFSKTLINLLHSTEPESKVVRIDPDEIRKDIPQYNGGNSSTVQHACSLAARNIFYSVLHRSQNFIYDGTFAVYKSAKDDIEIAIKKGRRVGIFYIFQRPELAWAFTKKREAVEGRPVPKKVFIDAFFSSRDNVNKIKSEFGKKVRVNFVEKDFENKDKKYRIDIDKIESFIKNEYNPFLLEKMLSENV